MHGRGVAYTLYLALSEVTDQSILDLFQTPFIIISN